MFPLSKISVVVHAECWYRPVSGAALPTAREGPQVSRADSGFSIVSLLLEDLLSHRLRSNVDSYAGLYGHLNAQLTAFSALSSTGEAGERQYLFGRQLFDFIPHDEALQNGKLVNCEQTRGKEYGFIWGGATNTFVYLNVLDTVVSSPAPSRE